MIKCTTIVFLLILLLGTKTHSSNGANILGIFGTHSPSHVIVHMAVMKTLADRGHNITVVTQMKPKLAAHENITVIVAPPTPERKKFMEEYMKQTFNDKPSIWTTMMKAVLQANVQLEGQMEFMVHPNFKELYENPQTKFDLVNIILIKLSFKYSLVNRIRFFIICSKILPVKMLGD